MHRVLDDLGLRNKPEILVFNQVDRLPRGVGAAMAVRFGAVAISALQSVGLDDLIRRASEVLWREGLSEAGRQHVPAVAAKGGRE